MNTAQWAIREENRFHTGEYKPIPNDILVHLACYGVYLERLHFAHLAVKVAGNIAFTESDDKGERDIQATMKFGKYLTRFHGDKLPAPIIAQCATVLRGIMDKPVLKIAITAEEIEHVYTNGPHSCMAHPKDSSEFSCWPHHPTAVYAGPDTAVAYIERDGRITGRTVLNTRDNTYVRPYGDTDNLIAALDAAGYSKGSLDGCRLALLSADNGAEVCPYLDGAATDVSVSGDYLRVSRYNGDFVAEFTNGLLTEDCDDIIGHCACCESRIPDFSDYVTIGDGWSGDLVCSDCGDEVVWLDDCQEYRWTDDSEVVHLPSGESVLYGSIGDYNYCMDADGDLAHIDDVIYIEDTGEYHKPDDCVEDFNGEYILAADAVEYETVDGETRYALDPDDDPDYRTGDMFAESA